MFAIPRLSVFCCFCAAATYNSASEAQRVPEVTNWHVSQDETYASGDQIVGSGGQGESIVRITLSCLRTGADSTTKLNSSVGVGIRLLTGDIDIDVQQIPHSSEDYDLCPMPSPTPYNPYNTVPFPCNRRWVTTYTTDRSIHILEQVPPGDGKLLKLAAPIDHIQSVTLERDLNFFDNDLIYYGLISSGKNHLVKIVTKSAYVKTFLDHCKQPSKEQNDLLSELRKKEAAAKLAAEQRAAAKRAEDERAEREREVAIAKAAVETQLQSDRRAHDLLAQTEFMKRFDSPSIKTKSGSNGERDYFFTTTSSAAAFQVGQIFFNPGHRVECGLEKRFCMLWSEALAGDEIHLAPGVSCSVPLWEDSGPVETVGSDIYFHAVCYKVPLQGGGFMKSMDLLMRPGSLQ